MFLEMNNGKIIDMVMRFFFGENNEIFFSRWHGNEDLGMYILALVLVFTLALNLEFITHCYLNKEKSNNDVFEGLVETIMYGLRIGLAYMMVLAVMSFNGGVFIVAVAGHTLGFLMFGSKVFKKTSPMIYDCKASEFHSTCC
ncbi:secondary carrier transporter [Lithospermum erythrorhizon]|uniref:Copper transport protein n=1 Tax=Lithospermum erythrorhizon TaxID=34254 RepID=A0AAV3RYG2_LITER